MIRQLCEKIVDNGIKNTNFFNGRLLAAEDLQVEQQAQRQHEALLGQALGPGIISGLEVSLDGFVSGAINSTVKVTSGMAINHSGLALSLPDDVQVAIAQPPAGASSASSTDFGTCTIDKASPTSVGIYLLLLSPARDFRGSAPLAGLGQNGKISNSCGKRFDMEGVQFRLVKVDLDDTLGLSTDQTNQFKKLISDTSLPWSTALPVTDSSSLSMLRNMVAYQFFGADAAFSFARNPFQQVLMQGDLVGSYGVYGLLDKMITSPNKPVSGDDVPLALIYWTTRGVRFVDNWSVRRRTAQPFSSGPLGYIYGDRRTREGEAMILQFNEQLQALLNGPDGFPKVGPASLQANKFFIYLPPAGLLIIPGAGSLVGIQPQVFFQGIKMRDFNQDPLYIEGARLPALLHDAALYPPIDPSTQEFVWLYSVHENSYALAHETSNLPPQYLVFANGHIPYRGKARDDLGYWNFGNFA